MNMEDLLVKAATWQYPEQLPVKIGMLPSLWKKDIAEMKRITARFPQFFGNLSQTFDYDTYTPDTNRLGGFTDEWGCVWGNIEEGQYAIVTGHPLKNREDIPSLEIPSNRDGRIPHGYMYLRILDLRGFEEAMVDFAEEPPELQMLIDKILEYNKVQFSAALQNCGGRLIWLGDDLGMQTGIPIGKAKWIKYLKPCFTTLYKMVHDAGVLVYAHTDGCCWEIVPDLAEAGADIINLQYRANGLDNIVRTCKGKIPVSLDFDRQAMPFASPASIEAHIRECVEALYDPRGGLELCLELGPDVKYDVIEAAIEAIEKYRYYKG
jgi:uroporphyrinogen decarboxylase